MAGIVVGYDGTESSKAALDVAIGLAKDVGEPVLAVFGYGVNPMGGEVTDHVKTLKEHGEKVTAEAVETAKKAGVDADVVLSDLEGAEALTAAADAKDARMIVVASRGEGPIRGAILGATAYRLVHTSEKPVLVVPVR
jgi:nucleotide-binding universal stress UspA family protein